MRKDTYEYLREQYPELIYMDSLYRILGVAKRTAQYLITNGIIPSIDTHRKTWRYQIRLDDVIAYLYERDKHGSGIPVGALSSRREPVRPKPLNVFMPSYDAQRYAKFLTMLMRDIPDVIALFDAVRLTGSSKAQLTDFVRKGALLHFKYEETIMIPKKSLIGLMANREYLDMNRTNPHIQRLSGEYEIWCATESSD